ncbi:hypothetical protein QBC44DRAFT_330485, partial [Cladorrhinum sp. PSN332]
MYSCSSIRLHYYLAYWEFRWRFYFLYIFLYIFFSGWDCLGPGDGGIGVGKVLLYGYSFCGFLFFFPFFGSLT